MAGRFLLRRSESARREAQRKVEASAESIATLVALVTSLADRMDAMPSAGVDRDRDRRARVHTLRRAAEAGTRTIEARRLAGRAGQHAPRVDAPDEGRASGGSRESGGST